MSSKDQRSKFYVIAKKGAKELVTTVMSAGSTGEEEALVVFTQKSAADVYLNQAGWVETETTAELGPAAFLKWLLTARDSGPTLLVINPDRVHQDDEIRQTVIPVDELLNRLGPAILDCLHATEFAAV